MSTSTSPNTSFVREDDETDHQTQLHAEQRRRAPVCVSSLLSRGSLLSALFQTRFGCSWSRVFYFFKMGRLVK